CAACSTRVEKVLNKMDAVDAQVNLATESATVTYDTERVEPGEVIEKINRLGYRVESEKLEFLLTGMTCAACSNRIEKVLNKQVGVEKAVVNLTSEIATVQFFPSIVTAEQLIEKI